MSGGAQVNGESVNEIVKASEVNNLSKTNSVHQQNNKNIRFFTAAGRHTKSQMSKPVGADWILAALIKKALKQNHIRISLCETKNQQNSNKSTNAKEINKIQRNQQMTEK